MPKTMWLLLVIPLLMTGCVNGQENDTFCQLAKPIYLEKQDKLTPNTARIILSHDETGRIYCGWERV